MSVTVKCHDRQNKITVPLDHSLAKSDSVAISKPILPLSDAIAVDCSAVHGYDIRDVEIVLRFRLDEDFSMTTKLETHLDMKVLMFRGSLVAF